MPYDSQGTFTRVMNWEQDRINDIEIVSDRHDAEDDNFANGFNLAFCRDGRAVATGNFKMGNFKITGMANGESANDAVNKGQLTTAITNLNIALQANIDAIETLIKTKIYGIGSTYVDTTGTDPNTTLGFGTWTLLTSSVVTTVASTTPVIGNGSIMKFQNAGTNPSHPDMYIGTSNDYNLLQGGNSGAGDSWYLNTDGTKSGVIADTSNLATKITLYIWQRTA